MYFHSRRPIGSSHSVYNHRLYDYACPICRVVCSSERDILVDGLFFQWLRKHPNSDGIEIDKDFKVIGTKGSSSKHGHVTNGMNGNCGDDDYGDEDDRLAIIIDDLNRKNNTAMTGQGKVIARVDLTTLAPIYDRWPEQVLGSEGRASATHYGRPTIIID